MFKKDHIFVINSHEFMSFTRFLIDHGMSFRYGVANEHRDADTGARTCSIEIIVRATKRAMRKIYRDLDMIYNYNLGVDGT